MFAVVVLMAGAGGGYGAVDAAYQNLRVFSELCWRGSPGHLTNASFHDELYEILMYHGGDGEKFRETRRLHVEAPREHAKTTCVSVVYPLWRIGRDRNIRVVVVSRTGALATSINREVRRNIEGNQRYREVFPEVVPSSPWGDEAFQVERTQIMKSPTFYGVGLEGSMTGMRADLLILDDPYDLNEMRTEASRERVREWIESVAMPVLVPDGEIVFICTRWHEDDYAGRILGRSVENGGDWVVKVYRAVENLDDPVDQWKALWPEKWPPHLLEKRRRDIGSLMFKSLYQNDPAGIKGALFKSDWLSYYDPLVFDPATVGHMMFVMAVDPAISESPEADQTAITTIAVDRRTRDIYLLDVWVGRISFPDQVKKIVEYAQRSHLPFIPKPASIGKVGVESTAYQKALYSSIYQYGLPVVEVKHSRGSKWERMLGMQPHFENGRIKLPDPNKIRVNWMDKFTEEYINYPRGKHNDILDSLEIAVEIAGETRGKSSMSYWMRPGRV
ncbi:MAG: hypothetical protein KKA68_21130 [Gammaproteobacteria bacterium]|nr:hypothetical protein [Gammaproteobacteria bacterium]